MTKQINSDPTTISCMYCFNTWTYKGGNLTNVCCPRCKNRFDVTKGKALNFNVLLTRINELESQVVNLQDQINHCRNELTYDE